MVIGTDSYPQRIVAGEAHLKKPLNKRVLPLIARSRTGAVDDSVNRNGHVLMGSSGKNGDIDMRVKVGGFSDPAREHSQRSGSNPFLDGLVGSRRHSMTRCLPERPQMAQESPLLFEGPLIPDDRCPRAKGINYGSPAHAALRRYINLMSNFANRRGSIGGQ